MEAAGYLNVPSHGGSYQMAHLNPAYDSIALRWGIASTGRMPGAYKYFWWLFVSRSSVTHILLIITGKYARLINKIRLLHTPIEL